VLPHCPIGTTEYPSFVASHGPHCPNALEHTAAFLASQCASSRALLWDVAISYSRANQLPWNTKISRASMKLPWDKATGDTFETYPAKGPGLKCMMGTNDFPPFVLSEGPRCPNLEAHNHLKPTLRVNGKVFDSAGIVLTNSGP
jgi:hypothetical protein